MSSLDTSVIGSRSLLATGDEPDYCRAHVAVAAQALDASLRAGPPAPRRAGRRRSAGRTTAGKAVKLEEATFIYRQPGLGEPAPGRRFRSPEDLIGLDRRASLKDQAPGLDPLHRSAGHDGNATFVENGAEAVAEHRRKGWEANRTASGRRPSCPRSWRIDAWAGCRGGRRSDQRCWVSHIARCYRLESEAAIPLPDRSSVRHSPRPPRQAYVTSAS
jgi:hypothetical protein